MRNRPGAGAAERHVGDTTGPHFFDHLSWGVCQAVYPHGAFGWNGGFGSSWLVDPVGDVAVIVLTQRLFGRLEPPQVHVEIQATALKPAKRCSRLLTSYPLMEVLTC